MDMTFWSVQQPISHGLFLAFFLVEVVIIHQFDTWAVFKIPLSFHYTGWFIMVYRDSPIIIPNILGSIIHELIINQQGFWTLLTWELGWNGSNVILRVIHCHHLPNLRSWAPWQLQKMAKYETLHEPFSPIFPAATFPFETHIFWLHFRLSGNPHLCQLFWLTPTP